MSIEITEFQETNSIASEKLRVDLPGVVIPQMYYYIDDSKLLNDSEKKLKPADEKIVHDFSNISGNLICRH